MGFAEPHRFKLDVLSHNGSEGERERERSGRHDLIVVENEFHLLSHSKFIAFVQQERVREKKQFIIIWLMIWMSAGIGWNPLQRNPVAMKQISRQACTLTGVRRYPCTRVCTDHFTWFDRCREMPTVPSAEENGPVEQKAGRLSPYEASFMSAVLQNQTIKGNSTSKPGLGQFRSPRQEGGQVPGVFFWKNAENKIGGGLQRPSRAALYRILLGTDRTLKNIYHTSRGLSSHLDGGI